MEIFDAMFWGVGNAVVGFINRIFKIKFSLGDGGKIVTGFIFFYLIVLAILFVIKLIGYAKLGY